jgi:hypothetical protein
MHLNEPSVIQFVVHYSINMFWCNTDFLRFLNSAIVNFIYLFIFISHCFVVRTVEEIFNIMNGKSEKAERGVVDILQSIFLTFHLFDHRK